MALRPQVSISLPEQELVRAAQRTVTETMAECQAGVRENSLLKRPSIRILLVFPAPQKGKMMLPAVSSDLMSTMAPDTTPVS